MTRYPHAQATRLVEALIEADAVDLAVAQIGAVIVSAGRRCEAFSAGGRCEERRQ